MRYLDGKIYKGEFRDNKRNGPGEMMFSNGNLMKGFWEDGV